MTTELRAGLEVGQHYSSLADVSRAAAEKILGENSQLQTCRAFEDAHLTNAIAVLQTKQSLTVNEHGIATLAVGPSPVVLSDTASDHSDSDTHGQITRIHLVQKDTSERAEIEARKLETLAQTLSVLHDHPDKEALAKTGALRDKANEPRFLYFEDIHRAYAGLG